MEPPKYETAKNKLISNEPITPNGSASQNIEIPMSQGIAHGSEEEIEEWKKNKCLYATIRVLIVCSSIVLAVRFILLLINNPWNENSRWN